MRKTPQLKSAALAMCVAGLITMPVFAADGVAQNESSQNAQLETLRAQVSTLQRQMNSLKKHMHKHHRKHKQVAKSATSTPEQVAHAHTDSNPNPSPRVTEAPRTAAEEDDGEYVDQPVHLTGRELIKMIREEQEFLPFDLDVPGQAFVSTGPYVGVPIQFSGGNLIINNPTVNIDVLLLGIRKSIHKQLEAMGGEIFKEPYHSHLLYSGTVSGQAGYFNPGGKPSRTDLNITNVALDAFFLGPSDWTLGFVEFSYDSSPPISNGVYTSTSSYRTSNSRVFINKAFVTLGDLSKTPFYGSFGQFFVPFGTYSSVMISDTFTRDLTGTKARALLVGYQEQTDNALYGSAYLFRGDSHAASVSKVNNGGINVGYKYKYAMFSGNWGGGVIANIADSAGMQLGTGFDNYEQISHRVPGYNLRGVFGLGERLDFIGEYVGAATSFNVNDMSFNGHGAKPWALDMQLAYTFKILEDRPSSLALVYDKSNQALALGVPSARYAVVLATSLLRNTLQALEFRHDRNYAASNSGNGPVGASSVVGSGCTSSRCTASGKADNAVTASFDYYF